MVASQVSLLVMVTTCSATGRRAAVYAASGSAVSVVGFLPMGGRRGGSLVPDPARYLIERTIRMYAIVRKNEYDPEKLAHAADMLGELRQLHSAQPGYVGSIEIDAGGGQRVVVNLWETEQDASAGQTVLLPHVQRLLEPLMVGPSQLITVGEVAATDLAPQR
jgi:hypothetical protein